MPDPSDPSALDRRAFLKLGALVTGGFTLCLYLRSTPAAYADAAPIAPAPLTPTSGPLFTSGSAPAPAPRPATPQDDFRPSAFIRISSQGLITLTAKNPELGQGIKTALPLLMAEELEAPWESIVVEQADFEPRLGGQFSGGSSAIAIHYEPCRRLGAAARLLLITAAAQTWAVPAAECFAEAATVIHRPSRRVLTYGELASLAATLPVPDLRNVPLKAPRDFKLLGRRTPGVDNVRIVTGQPLFASDQKLPGLLYATYLRAPTPTAEVATANLDALKQLPGVQHVFTLSSARDPRGLHAGVAILAASTWQAFQAQARAEVSWTESASPRSDYSSATLAAQAQAHMLTGAPVAAARELRHTGQVDDALAAAAQRIEAVYTYPYLAHATLEPQNATALFRDGRLEIWAPTQDPSSARDLIAHTLALPKDKITLHLPRAGGGFGRRLMSDFLLEAAALAHRLAGRPIQLVWTRTQDFAQDYYRPAGWHALAAGLDPAGNLTAWHDHFITLGQGSAPTRPSAGADISADEFPSRFIPHFRLLQSVLPSELPTGWWRAPGSSAYAWVFQSFLDELAHAARRDPLEYRLALLGADREIPPSSGNRGRPYHTGRMKNVLRLAAARADWGRPARPRGQGQGIAFHYSHSGYVTVVADVSVTPAGQLRVERLTAAVDVGPLVNLSSAEHQVQGALLDGLSAAWLQQITVADGRIQQRDFSDYPLLRFPDAPRIEVHFVPSEFAPTGLSEPALPPVAPAVCNALFAATGHRVRALPLSTADLRWS